MRSPFTREQLLETNYNPWEDPSFDRASLKLKYGQYLSDHGADAVHHLAAIRGVWDDKQWYWMWGYLHDDIGRMAGVPVLGRFRNQYLMSPRVEFREKVDVAEALRQLLEGTPIESGDFINIECAHGRFLSIGEALMVFQA